MANLLRYTPPTRLGTFASTLLNSGRQRVAGAGQAGASATKAALEKTRGALARFKASQAADNSTGKILLGRAVPEGSANLAASAANNTEFGKAIEQATGFAPSSWGAAAAIFGLFFVRKGPARKALIPAALGFLHATVSRTGARLPAAVKAALTPGVSGYEGEPAEPRPATPEAVEP